MIINIEEKKTLYGNTDVINRLEHNLLTKMFGIIIKNYSYSEIFIQEDDPKNLHKIGFKNNELSGKITKPTASEKIINNEL